MEEVKFRNAYMVHWVSANTFYVYQQYAYIVLILQCQKSKITAKLSERAETGVVFKVVLYHVRVGTVTVSYHSSPWTRHQKRYIWASDRIRKKQLFSPFNLTAQIEPAKYTKCLYDCSNRTSRVYKVSIWLLK